MKSESVAGVPGWLGKPLTLARITSLARCRAERSVIITIQLADGATVPVNFRLTFVRGCEIRAVGPRVDQKTRRLERTERRWSS